MKAFILFHDVDGKGYHNYFCRVETTKGSHFFKDVRKPTNPVTIYDGGYAHCVYDAKKRTFWLINKKSNKEDKPIGN